MSADLTLIHAERRDDYGVDSAVRVYLRKATGELVIDERFDRGQESPFTGANRVTISADGAKRILDVLQRP